MARPHPALIELAAGRSLPEVEDFIQLLDSALEHRMHGLLWSRVEAGEVALDESWQQILAMLVLKTEERHRRLWNELKRVGTGLASIGVEAATFKGVTSEARWYDRMGERPCSDLDILIGPDSYSRADDIVEIIQPDHPLLGHFADLVQRGFLQSLPLLHEGMSIDLHFDLLKMGIETRQRDLIWNRTLPYEVPGGPTVRVLDPEVALIHWLWNLNRDRFRFVLGFAEAQRIMVNEHLDWDFIEAFVSREGLGGQFRCSMAAVCSTIGIPNAVDPPRSGLRTTIWQTLWRPAIRLQGDLSIARYIRRGQWVLPLIAQGRALETASWWLSTLIPPKAFIDHQHPGQRGPYAWRLLAGRTKVFRDRIVRQREMREDDAGTATDGSAE